MNWTIVERMERVARSIANGTGTYAERNAALLAVGQTAWALLDAGVIGYGERLAITETVTGLMRSMAA